MRGHRAHLHHRGARPDRAPHEDDRRAHRAAFECDVRVRIRAQLPADHQPRRPRPSSPAACMADVVGADNVHEFEPTMGAEDFSYFLQDKPGCYFLIGNGDGAHREGGHGMGPCMLHNPSYDFNDDLIPLGATVWVRLAEEWLAAGALTHERLPSAFLAELPEARRSSWTRRAAPARPSTSHDAPDARPRRRGAGAWTWRATARPTPSALLVADQRLPRRRGVLRLRRAGCAAARCGVARCACSAAGVAVLYVHALNPYGFSWWRRTTHENVDLNRNFHDFSKPLPRNPSLRRDRAAARARRPGRPRADVQARSQRYIAEHGEKALPGRHLVGGQHKYPARPVLRRPRPDLEQPHAAPGAARARPALHAAGLDRSAHRPRAERLSANASLPAATMPPRCSARAPGGAQRRDVDLRRLLVARRCSPA